MEEFKGPFSPLHRGSGQDIHQSLPPLCHLPLRNEGYAFHYMYYYSSAVIHCVKFVLPCLYFFFYPMTHILSESEATITRGI